MLEAWALSPSISSHSFRHSPLFSLEQREVEITSKDLTKNKHTMTMKKIWKERETKRRRQQSCEKHSYFSRLYSERGLRKTDLRTKAYREGIKKLKYLIEGREKGEEAREGRVQGEAGPLTFRERKFQAAWKTAWIRINTNTRVSNMI